MEKCFKTKSTLFAAIFLTLCFIQPAVAKSKKVLLKAPLMFSTSLPLLGDTIPLLAKQIKTASNGEIVLKYYEPGKLVPPFEILGAVSSGKVNAGFSSPAYWQGKIPAAALFSAVPFGPEADEYLGWVLYGNGLKLWQKMYDDNGYNVKVLPAQIISPETSGWFSKPIKSVDDLKGLKMRFFGLGGKVMQKLGVAVTLLPAGEIFQALEKGVIDATEFSFPLVDQKLGFHKIVKYNYYPGWHQQATLLEMLINKDTWNKMSKSQQAFMEMATRSNLLYTLAYSESVQGAAIRENLQNRGVKNMVWSPQMLNTFKKTWEELVAEQTANDPLFKTVWQDLSKFREEYAYWKSLAFLPRN